jgi:hypothetical protein
LRLLGPSRQSLSDVPSNTDRCLDHSEISIEAANWIQPYPLVARRVWRCA